jgi:hypothetical protein
MIIGQNHHRLEKRINAALLSGKAHRHETIFLQKISMQLYEYRNNARLSDAQARYLHSILDRLKPASSSSPAPERSPQCPGPSSPQLQPEQPKPFRVEDCFIKPQPSPLRSSTPTQSGRPSTPPPAPNHIAPGELTPAPSPEQHSKASAESKPTNPPSSKPAIQPTATPKTPPSPPDEATRQAWFTEYFAGLEARRQHAQNVKAAQDRRWRRGR